MRKFEYITSYEYSDELMEARMTLNNFNEWYEEADIPKKIDGVWIDLETGIPFSDRPQPTRRTSTAKKVKPSFALKGSVAQKEWAYKIKDTALRNVGREIIEKVHQDKRMKHAKWWIENRNLVGKTQFLRAQIELTIREEFQASLITYVNHIKHNVSILEQRKRMSDDVRSQMQDAVQQAEKLLSSDDLDKDAYFAVTEIVIAACKVIDQTR